MIDYKFNIGDKVKILKLDTWSCESMRKDIGKIGVIVNYFENKEGLGYDICLEDDESRCLYQEDSLELVTDNTELANENMINKKDVLAILYETKESGIFNHGTICDLIRRVRELPCK